MTGMDEMVWTSLPVPGLILDRQDRIVQINPAAEGFLMTSARSIIGQPVWDKLAVDAPIEEALERDRFMSPEEAKEWGLIDEILADRGKAVPEA